MPIEVTPRVPRQAPAAPVVTGGNAVALAFSGLPGGSIYPSDQLTGCLLLRAEHDFLAPEISIYLQLRSSVHWPTGFTSRYKYHVLTRDEPLRLHANQPAELPFSCLVPGRLPAPSIKSYDPGEAAHNLAGAWTAARLNAVARRFRSKSSSAKGMLSTEWYLVARVKRQVGPAIKIRQNIIIVYP